MERRELLASMSPAETRGRPTLTSSAATTWLGSGLGLGSGSRLGLGFRLGLELGLGLGLGHG